MEVNVENIIDSQNKSMTKFIGILLMVISLMMASCSKDEGILSGKKFSYEIFHVMSCSSDYDMSISTHAWNLPIKYLESYNDYDYVHFNSLPSVAFIEELLPRQCYKSVTVFEGKYIYDRNEEITDSIFTIEFSDKQCVVQVHAVKCSLAKDQVLNCKQRIYHFNEGIYNIGELGSYIQITADEMNIISVSGQLLSSIVLTNYQGIFNGKCNYQNLIERPNDLSRSFSYTINGNDVLLKDEQGNMCGMFDLKENSLKNIRI